MNINDFEFDRKSDVVEDESRTKPRVSGDHIAVDSSDNVSNGDGDNKGECVNLVGSEEIRVRVWHGDDDESSDKVTHAGAVDNTESEDVSTVDYSRRSEEIRFSDEEMETKVSEDESSDRNGGTAQPLRAIDNKLSVRNIKLEQHPGSRARKGKLEGGKSQYDSMLTMFDEFAANDRGVTVVVGPSKPLGYGYDIGDMVWGKVKSHPWWPGHIYSEEYASASVRRSKRDGDVLVAFFGDSSYGWFDPAELIPFDPNFTEKSQQTNSRTFIKAVEEAVDEASRRCGLGLACWCRNPYNFRPTNVQGYFAVDVGDYEPGGVYSANQIGKARDSFQPRETLAFIKQLALAPSSHQYGGIHFTKSKATVLAYRKAVFEEFDETYAQAFGFQPERPSRGPTQEVAQPVRAPLSGPLVIAEALGKRKSSAKPIKTKDQAKKDRYLFQRRVEQKELKPHQINQAQAPSSAQPVYVEGSLAIAAGDYVLQKRAPAVSIKPEVVVKHEETGTLAKNGASAFRRDVTGKEASTLEEKCAVSKFSMAGAQSNTSKVQLPASCPVGQAPGYSSNLIEVRSSLDKGKGTVLEMEGILGSDVVVGPISRGGSGLVDVMPHTFNRGEATIDFKDDLPTSAAFKLVEAFEQPRSQLATVELHGREQVQGGCSGAHLLVAADAKLQGEGPRMRADGGPKKAKVRKRPGGDLGAEKSVPLEKKKRKKELMSTDSLQMHPAAGNGGVASVGKVAGKSVQVASASGEEFHVDHQKKDDRASSSLLPDTMGTQQMAGIGHIELELPQLLTDLQALALNPFHGVVRRSPATIRQIFLRFRSLVYQKSLVLLPPSENESNETGASRSPAVTVACDNPPGENGRDLPSFKPPKPRVRPDDPTKGGRKRGPSDRQEEMAAKKKKKMNDLKLLATEKKATQRTPEAQRGDGKEAVTPPPKSVKPVFKKTEPLSRALDPTMLVMKFPPRGTLPSISELKARFARFGPLDHSGTRVFWKSSTCRVVYLHKVDAQTALKFVEGSNSLFGNTNVRCYTRLMGVAAPDSESGNVQREDATTGTPQSRDSAIEQRPAAAAALTSQPLQQSAVQLKSCLKKSSGDDMGSVTGGNCGGRGTPRVKFMLGGEESSRGGEQMMVGNKNFNNNASFADGGASSSSSHAMDFNSKNFQKVIPPSPLPILPLPTAQYPRPTNNLHYSEVVAPRNALNFNTPTAHPTTMPSASNMDIAQQMLGLLTKCNDVVTNVTGLLGYVPYHPL